MTQPILTPVITMAALRSWTQTDIDDDDPFAMNILVGVSIKLRQYGDPNWTAVTLPPPIRLMGELKAKNYFEHPTGASREQVDVLSETFVNEVLQGLTFTEAEQAELGEFAPADLDGPINTGLWSISTTREPMGGLASGTAYYRDSWGSAFPLLPEGYLQ